MRRRCTRCGNWSNASLCALVLLFPSQAHADAVADFYRGKTVSIYVGFPPAGGYDIYARIMAPYFSRHIPGNPTVTIRNMDGGSGVRAAALHHPCHAAGRHLARPVPRHHHHRQDSGRAGRLRSGQARLDRPHRLDRQRRHGLAHRAGADGRRGQAHRDHHGGDAAGRQHVDDRVRAQRPRRTPSSGSCAATRARRRWRSRWSAARSTPWAA